MDKSYAIVSLGCAKNLVDSEVMVEILRKRGYLKTESPELADILIVNTCGFIESAKRESIEMILDLVRYKQDGICQVLVVTGCLAQRYASDLISEIPEIDIIIGTGDYSKIADLLDSKQAGIATVAVGTPESESMLTADMIPLVTLTPKHTSFVKIADGCNHRCSYCIIPQLRGPLRSRSVEAIFREVDEKSRSNVQEIILVAQDVTQYGLDRSDKHNLSKLLRKLSDIETLHWLRLLYAYPKGITEELIDTIAYHEKICNYLDIPMQHCNDAILRAMKRPDRREDMVRLVSKLRNAIPGIALRSSFIVGFPGETEAQFSELLDYLKEVKLDRAGFFMYSQEEGTPAGTMPDQIPDAVKEERYYRALECQERIAYQCNQKMVGQRVQILVEEESGNSVYPYIGRSYRDAPEVDGQVHIQGNNLQIGSFADVFIQAADSYDLYGNVSVNPQEGDNN